MHLLKFLMNEQFQSAIAMTKDDNFFVRKTTSTVLNQVSDTPFVSVSVKDFCFGYQNGVINALGTLSKLANKQVPFEKFGLLAKVNIIKNI